ncbi:MAG TPA: peptidylprolyl isomerase [Acidimicrobiales bacterium]
MKRFLVLLVVVAGGLAWAAFGVPSNAATVNGQAISQSQLNSDVTAISNSATYFCYLNGQQVVESDGGAGIAPVNGVGQQTSAGPRTSATTAFVANYLDTEVGHQLVDELAAQRHLTVTAADLTTARTQFEDQISSIMSDVEGSQYQCSSGTTALTGQAVLATMPSSFINEQVKFFATVNVLEESLSGLATSTASLKTYFEAHQSQFDTACFTVAQYTSESTAEATRAAVFEGGSFATLAAEQPQGGPQGCDVLATIISELPASADLSSLPLNTVSPPVEVDGQYLLIEMTSRSSTSFATAESAVKNAVELVQSKKAESAIGTAEHHASVTLDPRYGTWHSLNAQVLVPKTPLPADVLDAGVNSPVAAAASKPASS